MLVANNTAGHVLPVTMSLSMCENLLSWKVTYNTGYDYHFKFAIFRIFREAQACPKFLLYEN